MSLTKIIATVGPDILNKEAITQMIQDGVSVFRFNFKHNDPQWHADGIQLIKKTAEELDVPIATLIDLQGPSIRVNMPGESIDIREGEKLYFGEIVFEKPVKGFSISHPQIIEHLENGQLVLAEDGHFRFHVVKEPDQVYLESLTTGTLKTKKNLNIPGSDFPFPVLVDRDFEGIEIAHRHEVDFIALSFVRTADDIKTLREEMAKFNIVAGVISKIETQKALDHIDEIIDASDAVMIARGDLGVELPFEEVPYYQKMIIMKCLQKAKPVITATQMLNSMIEDSSPTRAEVSDVANAVFDLTDSIMLSGETASGKHPFEAVQAMARIAEYNEHKLTYDVRRRYDFHTNDTESYVVDMAYNLFISFAKEKADFGGFVVFTQTGRTVRLISRYRPKAETKAKIFAFAPNKKVRDMLSLCFGVVPFVHDITGKKEVMTDQILETINFLKEKELVKTGQYLIVLHGDVWAQEDGTSTVKLARVH